MENQIDKANFAEEYVALEQVEFEFWKYLVKKKSGVVYVDEFGDFFGAKTKGRNSRRGKGIKQKKKWSSFCKSEKLQSFGLRLCQDEGGPFLSCVGISELSSFVASKSGGRCSLSSVRQFLKSKCSSVLWLIEAHLGGFTTFIRQSGSCFDLILEQEYVVDFGFAMARFLEKRGGSLKVPSQTNDLLKVYPQMSNIQSWYGNYSEFVQVKKRFGLRWDSSGSIYLHSSSSSISSSTISSSSISSSSISSSSISSSSISSSSISSSSISSTNGPTLSSSSSKEAPRTKSKAKWKHVRNNRIPISSFGTKPGINQALERYVVRLTSHRISMRYSILLQEKEEIDIYQTRGELRKILVSLTNLPPPKTREEAVNLLAGDPLRFLQIQQHLWCIEEAEQEIQMKQYSKEGVSLLKGKDYLYVLGCPGLSEGRPSVLRGDEVHIITSPDYHPVSKKRADAGYVFFVNLDNLSLSLGKTFPYCEQNMFIFSFLFLFFFSFFLFFFFSFFLFFLFFFFFKISLSFL